jgi:hypothetical protein
MKIKKTTNIQSDYTQVWWTIFWWVVFFALLIILKTCDFHWGTKPCTQKWEEIVCL